MAIDNRTTGRNYPLPHPSNLLAEDVQRLRDALNAIDADVAEVDQIIDDLINNAPEDLDTLSKIATALNNRYTKAESDARYVQGVSQTENTFTGNGTQSTFTLTQAPPTRESLLLSVDGVVQPVSEYSLNGTALTLSEAPASGAKIRVLMLGVAGQVQSASTLNFAQAGIGAVTRTVESKLRDVVSVKDFGAKGDGTTDDGAAFLAASAALQSGQTLFIPAGHYVLNTNNNSAAYIANEYSYIAVRDKKNVSIIGEGVASTRIELTGAGYPCPIYFRDSDEILVDGLTIIGNNQAPLSTSQTGNALWAYYGAGASATAGRVRFSNLHLTEFKGSNWLSVYNGATVDVSDVFINNVLCDKGSDRNPANIGVSADQITVFTNNTGKIYNTVISNCICHADDVKKGIAIKDNVSKIVIDSCQVYNAGINNPNPNTGRYGIMLYNNAEDVVISNCIVDGGQDVGIYLLDTSNASVTGCILSGHVNSSSPGATLEKGALVYAASDGTVTGCIFRNNNINITCAPAQKGRTTTVTACVFESGANLVMSPLNTTQNPASVHAYGGGFYDCRFYNSSVSLVGVSAPNRYYYGLTFKNNQFYVGNDVAGTPYGSVLSGSNNGPQFYDVVFDGNYIKHTGGTSPTRAINAQGGTSFAPGLQITNNTFEGTFSEYVIALYQSYGIKLTNNKFKGCQPTVSGTTGYLFYLVESRGYIKDNLFEDCNENKTYFTSATNILGRTLPTWAGEPGNFVQKIYNGTIYYGDDGYVWDETLQNWSEYVAPRRGYDATSSATVEVPIAASRGVYLVGLEAQLGNYNRHYSGVLTVSENYSGSTVKVEMKLVDLAKTGAVDGFFGTLTVDFDYYASTTSAYTGSYYTTVSAIQATEGRPERIKFRMNGRIGGPSFTVKQVTLTPLHAS